MAKFDNLLNFLGWIGLFVLIALMTLFLTVSIMGFVQGFTEAWKEM